MSQEIISQLESEDAKQRFAAIKHIARDKDVTMLKTLADLADNDPDEQIRNVAARAVAYIKGEAKAVAPRTHAVVVSERDETRAKQLVDSALSYQIDGEKERALKELARALDANPNLENDAFFKSVLSETAEVDTEDALALLRDDGQRKQVARGERQRKQQQRATEHEDTVGRSNWSSAGMDLMIYALILVFATMFMPIVAAQAAQSFLNEQDAAWAEYRAEAAAGDPRATRPDPVDPEFVEMAEEISETPMLFGVGLGIGSGIYGLVALFITLFFTHLSARFIFGGTATFPHLIYKVVSLYNSRLPIFFGMIYVGMILTFLLGGGIIPMIAGGAVSLFSLFLSIKIIGRVGEAYDFGAAKGCMSMIVGSFVVGIISFIVQTLFFGALFASIMSSMPV